MTISPYGERLRACRNEGTALLAANFYNAETLLAILKAAKETGSDIILQASPSTLNYLGVEMATGMARAATKEIGAKAWLHLDHATDIQMIISCMESGFDSVMIDASERPLPENVVITREVVAMARSCSIAVEAELGYVPKLGQHDVDMAEMTSPEDAARFSEQTGVDALAVAIGNAHGFYKTAPTLDMERLASIREVTDTPLVLHGGSGLSPEQWQNAVKLGVAKVNFATEIKDTFMRGVRRAMAETDEIDMRKVFPSAMRTVTDLVVEKIRIVSREKRCL